MKNKFGDTVLDALLFHIHKEQVAVDAPSQNALGIDKGLDQLPDFFDLFPHIFRCDVRRLLIGETFLTPCKKQRRIFVACVLLEKIDVSEVDCIEAKDPQVLCQFPEHHITHESHRSTSALALIPASRRISSSPWT